MRLLLHSRLEFLVCVYTQDAMGKCMTIALNPEVEVEDLGGKASIPLGSSRLAA